MSEITKYVISDTNCKFEAMDKEETLAVLQQAIESGSLAGINPDAGFITKLKDGNGVTYSLWVGTTAAFNALTTKEANTFYILNDEDTLDTLDTLLENIINGVQKVGNAGKVNNLEIMRDSNGVLKIGSTIIPQKILIKDYPYIELNKDDTTTIQGLNSNDIYEIEYSINALEYKQFVKGSGVITATNGNVSCGFQITANTLKLTSSYSSIKVYIYRIYKIIE